MWIKLDFTPLFIGAIVVGLAIIALGLTLRWYFPKAAAAGLIIALVGIVAAAMGASFSSPTPTRSGPNIAATAPGANC